MQLPPYSKFPNLTTDSIILRQVFPEDLEHLLEISVYDGVWAGSVQEAQTIQDRIDADYENGSSIHWAIVDPENGTVVGTCGYYRGFEAGAGELGCILKKEFYGRGYMGKALEQAVRFGLKQMGLEKVIAITSIENKPALKLLRRLGFIETAQRSDTEIEFQYQKIK